MTIDKACAILCKLSYEDNPGPGFKDIKDIRYGIHTVLGHTVITFRGTDNFRNMLRDVFVVPKKINGVLIHGGVADGYRLVRDQLMKDIGELATGPVIANGHSYGGGLAKALAIDIGCELITFGCLRTLFRFGKKPQLKHRRIINSDDPVPMVPRIFYVHDSNEPEVFHDSDLSLIDFEDHPMNLYLANMYKENEDDTTLAA